MYFVSKKFKNFIYTLAQKFWDTFIFNIVDYYLYIFCNIIQYINILAESLLHKVCFIFTVFNYIIYFAFIVNTIQLMLYILYDLYFYIV